MKFWSDLINILKDIQERIKDIAIMIFDAHDNDISFESNYNPIATIKTEPIKVLDRNASRKNLIIQNIGMEPCYISLNGDISTKKFHCVLASDTHLDNQGNGGSIKLENWHGEVYAICKRETKLSVLEY